MVRLQALRDIPLDMLFILNTLPSTEDADHILGECLGIVRHLHMHEGEFRLWHFDGAKVSGEPIKVIKLERDWPFDSVYHLVLSLEEFNQIVALIGRREPETNWQQEGF